MFFVDQIVVVRKGKISEVGTYKELLDSGREFSDFLINYIQEEEDKVFEKQDYESLELVKGDLIQKMGENNLKMEIEKSRIQRSECNFSCISAFDKWILSTTALFLLSLEVKDCTLHVSLQMSLVRNGIN